jgi:hypothetical protein
MSANGTYNKGSYPSDPTAEGQLPRTTVGGLPVPALENDGDPT